MKRWLVVGALTVSGCNPGDVSRQGEAHWVNLPVATPNTIYVENLDFPEREPQLIRPRGDGSFEARVPAGSEERSFVVHVKNLASVPSVTPDEPVKSNITWKHGPDVGFLLVRGSDLSHSGVHINLVTEYISRRMDDYLDRLPADRIRYFQDRLAEDLIARDIDGDGIVTYDDALRLDPASTEHRAKLTFDYAAILDQPLSCNCSLRQTYANEPGALNERLNEAFAKYQTTELPGPDIDQIGVTVVSVGQGGSIKIDELPDITLGEANHAYRHDSNPYADTTITLRAFADEKYSFVRWVGCEQVQADGVCVMPSSVSDRTVSAQFGIEPALKDGVESVLRMMTFPSESYVATYDGRGMLTYVVSHGSDADAALAAIKQGSVLATALIEPALARVVGLGEGPRVVDAGRVQYDFSVLEVDAADVYKRVSASEPDRPSTIDDVQSISVTETEPDASSASGMRRSSKRVSRPIWLLGYGRAFDLGDGLYLTQPKGSATMAIARALSTAVEEHAPALRPGGAAEKCSIITGKDCALQLAERVGTYKKIFKVKLAVEANIDSTGTGHLNFALPYYIDFQSRGRVAVTVGASLSMGIAADGTAFKSCSRSRNSGESADPPASAVAAFVETGDPLNDAFIADTNRASTGSLGADKNTAAAAAAGCKSQTKTSLDEKPGAATKDVTLKEVEMELNKATPAGIAFPVKVVFKIGVEAKGSFGIKVKYIFEAVQSWDMRLEWGKRCEYWVVGCQSFNSSSEASKFVTGQKISGGFAANAEFAPFMSLGVYAGIRGLKEDLMRVEGKLSVPLRIAGYAGSVSYSTLQADKADGVAGLCYSGETGVVWGVDLKAEVGATVDTRFQKWGFTLGGEWDLFRYSYTYPLIPVTASKFSALEATGSCVRVDDLPVAQLPVSVSFKPGELLWDNAPSRRLTKTHELILQEDGNVVLYRLVRDGKAKIVDKVALWDTKQSTRYGSRITFQADGNLVQYDLNERPIWKSDTKRSDVRSLDLQQDGNLVIYTTNGAAIWSSGTQGK